MPSSSDTIPRFFWLSQWILCTETPWIHHQRLSVKLYSCTTGILSHSWLFHYIVHYTFQHTQQLIISSKNVVHRFRWLFKFKFKSGKHIHWIFKIFGIYGRIFFRWIKLSKDTLCSEVEDVVEASGLVGSTWEVISQCWKMFNHLIIIGCIVARHTQDLEHRYFRIFLHL